MDLLLLGAGIVLVVAGAELFFDAILAVAERFGLSAFILTIVISGFEVENLAAGIAANAKDLGPAAAGTFLGGATFIALGVAGCSALVAPLRARVPAPLLVWAALSPIPLLLLSRDGLLSRYDGALLLIWFAAVMGGLIRTGRSALGAAAAKSQTHPIFRLVGGLALLSAGGEVLSTGIQNAVERFGVSQSLLGNTVIAAGVEAEEIARVAVPSRRGRGDVALANIVGTVAHFVAFNAGAIAVVKPVQLDHASVVLHAPVACAATVLVCTMTGMRRGLGRVEGCLLLLSYAAYVAMAIATAA